MKHRSSVFLAALCIGTAMPALAQTLVVGTCKTASHHYTTIQSAINAAPANAQVLVCPGTYAEQLTITEPLTLKGISAPPLGNPILVFPAAAPAQNIPNGVALIGVATHGHSGSVNITGFDLQGGACDARNVSGIRYISTSGTVSGNVVEGFGPPCDGAGIGVENDDAWGVAVTVAGNVIRDIMPYGTGIEAVSGASSSKLNAQIQNNAISQVFTGILSSTNGKGVYASGNSVQVWAQGRSVVVEDAAVIDHNSINMPGTDRQDLTSGIRVDGNNGSVTNNVINVNGCCSFGITVFGKNVTVASNTVSATPVPDGDFTETVGIGNTVASTSIQSNSVSGFVTGIEMGCKAATVTSNTIVDATTGIDGVPAGTTPFNNFVNVTTAQNPCS